MDLVEVIGIIAISGWITVFFLVLSLMDKKTKKRGPTMKQVLRHYRDEG